MKLTSYGYKIPKKLISEEERVKIRTALIVKPIGVEDYGPLEEFPVYREDDNNMWVPKFFPIKEYVNLEIVSNNEKLGLDVDFTFKGSLRQDQVSYVDNVMTHINKHDSAVLCAQTGTGKCFGFDTEILMYDGSIKKIQDVNVNDAIMGSENNKCIVTSLASGKSQLYTVKDRNEFSINDSYTVNEGHIMTVYDTKVSKVIDITIEKIIIAQYSDSDRYRYQGLRKAVEFTFQKYKKLPVDPQLYGIMLANQVSDVYRDILNKMPNKTFLDNTEIVENSISMKISSAYKTCSISNRISFLQSFLSKISQSYHVKLMYQISRQEIFSEQGFIQSLVTGQFFEDVGFYINLVHGINVPNMSQLGKDIKFIMQSLACKNYKDYADLHYGTLNMISARYFIIVENSGYGDYYGFTLRNDNPDTVCNGRFLLGSCIVTHNTTMALNIAANINKKTLIIVHKTFLFNQWVERISQFLPDVKVGCIQGPIVEIGEEYGIVIGLLQSISMRTYSSDTFKDFGLLIIDECHHIPSEVFSRALYKIGCKKIVGLSATPIRKDGLTKILNWFVGEILIKPVLEGAFDTPIVNVIEFDSAVEPKYDRIKGRLVLPDYITKLTQDPLRNEMIVSIIIPLIRIGRKIIVLTDRREHCVELKKMILTAWDTPIASSTVITVGLYLGGMHKDELKASEACNVLLGSFSMCSEGFDCPQLDTLVLATPRSDIVQSAGRILRRRNLNSPLIIDIIDRILYSSYTKRYSHYKTHKFIVNRDKKEKKQEKAQEVTADIFL